MTQKPINKIERLDVDTFKNFDVPTHANALDNYQVYATKSAIYPGQGTPFGLMYAALGLAEAGEVQNKVKKAFRDDGVYSTLMEHEEDSLPSEMLRASGPVRLRSYAEYPLPAERREQIKKELGGVLWYVAAVCNELGLHMSEVALHNLEELCSRGERGTLSGDGDNR